jgi:hypothetical protein
VAINTKLLMGASALAMGVWGLILSFLPQEALSFAGLSPDGLLPMLVQVAGAMYLGFAMMNWMAKDSLTGGIYNRPIVMANVLHFVAAALALIKAALAARSSTGLLIGAAIYSLFGALFAVVLFTHPRSR